jgi:hypothetical protein
MATTETAVTAEELSGGEWPARIAALDRLPTEGAVAGELHAALVGLLAAPEADQRAKAVAAVVRGGAPLVPLLVAVLEDETRGPDARRAAVVALGRIGRPARAAAGALHALVADDWLGPPARAALAAIEPRRPRGFPLLWAAVAGAALLSGLVTAAPSVGGPLAAALGVVGLSAAVAVWRVRPGAAGVVWLAVVLVAAAAAVWLTGGLSDVFAEVARPLRR